MGFVSGFVVTKVVAVKIGPEGLAYVGQFQNTTALLLMFASGAINAGVTKYLSEYRNNPIKQQNIVTQAVKITTLFSLVIAIICIAGAYYFSNLAFHTFHYWIVYVVFGCCISFITINNLWISIYNGMGQIKKLTIINIAGSFFGIISTICGAIFFGIEGVLVASSFSSIAIFLINVFYKKGNILQINIKFERSAWDWPLVKLLSRFSLIAVVQTFASSICQLIVRGYIIKESVADAGYWQAVTRISDYYLLFITSILSVYYLPKLSGLNENSQAFKMEIRQGYKWVMPFVGIVGLSIWLTKGVIIKVLLSKSFEPMVPLFTFQLIGDFLKMASWLVAYIMLAKAMVKLLIITEILFTICFVFCSIVFINHFGVIGATYSFALSYFLYFIFMFYRMRKYVW